MGLFSSLFSSISVVFSTIAPIISKIIPYVNIAITIVNIVSKIVGLFKENETTEDLGDKALQAQEAGIVPENYENYDDYLQTIRDFQLDPLKSEEIEATEKQKMGLTVLVKGIEEKIGAGFAEMLPMLIHSNDYFTFDRIKSYFETIKETGFNVNYLVTYLKGEADLETKEKASEFLIHAEKQFNPDFKLSEFNSSIRDIIRKNEE